MLLAVDVGNTQTHLGAFDGEELAHDWRLTTVPSATADELAATLPTCSRSRASSFGSLDGAIVSTVVPQLGPKYEQLSEQHTGKRCLMVGPTPEDGDADPGRQPARAGRRPPGQRGRGPRPVKGACVTVDFGTSTNFDVVSGAGEYLGGVIGPGVEVSLEALTARAAKLPRIDLSSPEAAIGKHTVAAIQSGFAYGFAGLVDGIDRRLADELGEQATFIATGGLAHDDRAALRDDRRGRPAADPARPAADLRPQRET